MLSKSSNNNNNKKKAYFSLTVSAELRCDGQLMEAQPRSYSVWNVHISCAELYRLSSISQTDSLYYLNGRQHILATGRFGMRWAGHSRTRLIEPAGADHVTASKRRLRHTSSGSEEGQHEREHEHEHNIQTKDHWRNYRSHTSNLNCNIMGILVLSAPVFVLCEAKFLGVPALQNQYIIYLL